MIFYLASIFRQSSSFMNILYYGSSRLIFSALTALIITLVIGPYTIRKLQLLKFGQVVRDIGPASHLKKNGTPTMGGVMIIFSIVISTLLWADLSNIYVWLTLIILLGFGIVGFYDDYLKIKHKSSSGISAKKKYLSLSVISLFVIIGFYFYTTDANSTKLMIPLFKSFTPNLGFLFIILAYFTVVGSANAVNLTDGLDGLAIGSVILVTIGIGILSLIAGNLNIAQYLNIFYIQGSGELALICACIFGSGIGFLWFNSYPAQIFMGDVGSLALGGVIGIISVFIRQEILLIILGGIFVIETLSVIVQVTYFKYSKGKRIFLMTPIHHHFEKLNIHETKVVIRFWIVGFILLAITLATLKIR